MVQTAVSESRVENIRVLVKFTDKSRVVLNVSVFT